MRAFCVLFAPVSLYRGSVRHANAIDPLWKRDRTICRQCCMAAHGFLPGALKGVLQTVSEFTGFSQSVVLQIVLTVSPGLCLTACFHHKRWHIVVRAHPCTFSGACVPKDGGGFVVFALFPEFKSGGEIVIL